MGKTTKGRGAGYRLTRTVRTSGVKKEASEGEGEVSSTKDFLDALSSWARLFLRVALSLSLSNS